MLFKFDQKKKPAGYLFLVSHKILRKSINLNLLGIERLIFPIHLLQFLRCLLPSKKRSHHCVPGRGPMDSGNGALSFKSGRAGKEKCPVWQGPWTTPHEGLWCYVTPLTESSAHSCTASWALPDLNQHSYSDRRRHNSGSRAKTRP